MKRRGFSLIEVIVVMAIVAIMAGIMIPFAYKAWESADIDTTKERMSALKNAMVGDNKLIQNGVRTDFGYVGQEGQLPDTLADLLSGGFIGAGFDPTKIVKDAWGEDLSYTPVKDASGRWTSATLGSKGADRTNGTADDIVLPVDTAEVTPADAVQGSINITFSTPPQTAYTYSAKVIVTYRDGAGGWKPNNCGCLPVSISGSAGNTQVIYPGFSYSCTTAERLPAGIVKLQAQLFSDGTCTNSKQPGVEMPYTLHDRINTAVANLQILSVTP